MSKKSWNDQKKKEAFLTLDATPKPCILTWTSDEIDDWEQLPVKHVIWVEVEDIIEHAIPEMVTFIVVEIALF